ncbi:MAG: GNAT family N-acetyltransferase [Sphingobium sp.]
MRTDDPLDRPIWSALKSGWSSYAVGDSRALRLHTDYGPFAAPGDTSPASISALGALIPENGEAWLVEAGPLVFPADAKLRREAVLHQMIAPNITPSTITQDIVVLDESDSPAMLALAQLTVPGPFASRTHRLGRFLGVKDGGKLVAMAGERMRFGGYAEVSGVCTHPDYRGRGYAAALMRAVAQNMLRQGETPFLHSYASNLAAIALYESLGFRLRSPINMAVIGF